VVSLVEEGQFLLQGNMDPDSFFCAKRSTTYWRMNERLRSIEEIETDI